MPRFDARCERCERTWEVFLRRYRERLVCPCGGRAWVQLGAQVAATMNTYPFVHEHLGHHPVVVESPQHYRRLLRERGFRMKHGTKSDVGI